MDVGAVSKKLGQYASCINVPIQAQIGFFKINEVIIKF